MIGKANRSLKLNFKEFFHYLFCAGGISTLEKDSRMLGVLLQLLSAKTAIWAANK